MSLRSLAVLLLASCASAAAETPTYTNADLERVAPRRGETGALSVPAFPPEDDPPPSRRARPEAPVRQGEAFWRREAERVRERQRRLDGEAERLRQSLARERARTPGPGRRERAAQDGEARVRALEARLAALLARRRELTDDLEERARRARALPGWLR